MVEKDFIKELFADKLANAEAPVNPDLWNAISSKVAANSTVSSGLSAAAKTLIGLGTAAAITVVSLVYFNQTEEKPVNKPTEKVSKSNEQTADKDEIIVSENDKTAAETTNPAANPQLSETKGGFIYPVVVEEVFEEPLSGFRKDENIGSATQQNQQEEIIPVNKTKEPENAVSDKVSNPVIQEKPAEKAAFEMGELPNVFTPNNDTENDFFFIPLKGAQDFALTILNQDNEVIFRTTDPNFKWDGRDAQGNMVPAGKKYVYFFTAKDAKGEIISRHNKLEIRY